MPGGVEARTGNLGPDLRRCEEKIGYAFRDQSRLLSALTHASGAPHRLASNERLEFFGDAILGMVVCEMLFQRFPDCSEGELTKIKSVVVSRQTCARVAGELDLEGFLVLGKGMSGSRALPTSLLAGVYESLVAAIYLDGGHSAAKEFLVRTMSPQIDAAVDGVHGDNYKSLLQQLAQREYNTTPTYTLVDEKGPDHKKAFQVSARIGEREFTTAWGPNKKEAEQKAAQNALNEISSEPSTGESK